MKEINLETQDPPIVCVFLPLVPKLVELTTVPSGKQGLQVQSLYAGHEKPAIVTQGNGRGCNAKIRRWVCKLWVFPQALSSGKPLSFVSKCRSSN
jgi:hypothetical protein